MDYKKFYELSFDMMCVIREEKFFLVNSKFPAHLGYAPEDMVGRLWVDFLHPDDKEESLRAYGSETDRTCTTRFLSHEGKYIWLEWRFGRVNDEEIYATCHDVSQRKLIETQLGSYIIGLRRSEIEAKRARDEAEMMAYAASHDLQEPLRTIMNWGAFIKEDYGHLLPEKGQLELGYILESAARGRALVSDLLQLSRVGRESNFGLVRMNDVLDKAVIDVELSVRETEATIMRDGTLPEVWGDPSMLRLMVKNLLSNAVKFAKVGTHPNIIVGGAVTADGWEFSVRDDGVGIDPDYAEKVFGVFFRLGKERPGTGIGLAICQKIAKLHNGSIWIESSPSQGATVRFTISGKNTHETTTDIGSGGPSAGRKDAGASAVGNEDSTHPTHSFRWGGSPAVLAERGSIHGRTTPRSGTPRPKSPKDHGV